MKGLKRNALACALATAPFALPAGAFEALSDGELSDVTGQQGVTIEVSTALTIDQLEYSQDTNGSVLVDDIRVGGFVDGPDSNVDFRILVDLRDNGDARVRLSPMDFAPVDAHVAFGSMGISGDAGSATLISDFDMRTWVTNFDIFARVEDLDGNTGTTGSLDIETEFAIENLDVTFDVAAVSLEGFRLAGEDSLETLRDEPYFPDVDSVRLATEGAALEFSVGAGVAISDGSTEALRLNINPFVADVWMPTVNVGAESIGSIAIDNLTLAETQMAIYGRD